MKYKAMPAGEALHNNILIYGVGGLIALFIEIKIIDMLLMLTV
ncbi:hypothetical protein [Methanoregula sp.]